MMLKIAILGSRGIPPRYGGAETFVYELSKRLKKTFEIYVTCETNKFGIDEFEGIKRVHIWAHHTPTITIPSIYDVIATLYMLKKVRDVKLFYYVAPDGVLASVLAKLAGKKVIVNTDGIEWQRLLKRAKFVPWYLKPLYLATAMYMLVMEFLSCKIPHVTIADSIAIKEYLERTWRSRRTVYVAYGIRKLPDVREREAREILSKLRLEPYGYFLTIGRIVAENNIHLEIEAFKKTSLNKKLVIVGPTDPRDPYVKYLFKLKKGDKRIMFTGSIYDMKTLATLRKYCLAYIHPYTVGGTNPSLLEQLQYDRPIIAYDTAFHREVLGCSGIYFKSVMELANAISMIKDDIQITYYENQSKFFSWDLISRKYSIIFKTLLKS
ncbi:MAG: DUF1972 domain-containing protein [Desulfurococcaceae archaeon]